MNMDGETLLQNVITFGRLLSAAGVPITPEQTRSFALVLGSFTPLRRSDIKAAGRSLFAKSRSQAVLYDVAFDLFWRRSTVEGAVSLELPRIKQRNDRESFARAAPANTDPPSRELDLPPPESVRATGEERLRHADFADLSPDEASDAASMLAALAPRLPTRRSRRSRVGRVGTRLALRRMARDSMTTGGEAIRWYWKSRVRQPRPIVLVCDISGSMEPYSRFMLRFAHTLQRSGARVESFVFGTRLTRITRELRVRNPNAALQRVGHRVVDWNGGTRIGASLHELNRRWVRRTIRSGAVVLLVSDGWERGEPDLLGREIAILQRSCHRLIWLDPLASRAGFEPATEGLRAVMPYIDDFLPCASVASLEELAGRLGHLANAPRRRTGRPLRYRSLEPVRT